MSWKKNLKKDLHEIVYPQYPGKGLSPKTHRKDFNQRSQGKIVSEQRSKEKILTEEAKER